LSTLVSLLLLINLACILGGVVMFMMASLITEERGALKSGLRGAGVVRQSGRVTGVRSWQAHRADSARSLHSAPREIEMGTEPVSAGRLEAKHSSQLVARLPALRNLNEAIVDNDEESYPQDMYGRAQKRLSGSISGNDVAEVNPLRHSKASSDQTSVLKPSHLVNI
jgi:hypothetical protein